MNPTILNRHTYQHPAWMRVAILLLCSLLGACSNKGGGYHQADGPGVPLSPAAAAAIPDAVPRIETLSRATSRPYTIKGRRYTPMTSSQAFSQTGLASWYGRQFHGNNTANGERYDMYAMTAAHPTLPLPSYARVTRLDSGKSIIVRINDRGPFNPERIIDLSYAAAAKLDFIGQGTTRVRVQAITHDDIRKGQINKKQINPPAHVSANAGAATNVPVYLQFGAFQQAANARHLMQTLTRQLPASEHPRLRIHQRDTLHHVWLGPYANRAEALAAARRIYQQTGQVVSLAY